MKQIKYIVVVLTLLITANFSIAAEKKPINKKAKKEVSAEKKELNKLTLENKLFKQKSIKKLRELVAEKAEDKAKYELMIGKEKIKMAELEAEQKLLALENKLMAEKDKKALAQLRQKNAKIKLENESQLQLAKLKNAKEVDTINLEKKRMDFEMAKLRIEKTKMATEAAKLKVDLDLRKKKKEWKNEANKEPKYLLKPFKNGVLTISDRRIALNGSIRRGVADFVTERIHYFNNKSTKLPIFIVIDICPGGSVMEGFRILKAMETSQAPIHVVVKSFAASMAAAITTLAPYSYAYPNAIILHHQMSSGSWGNMTEMKEQLKNRLEWERRVATPVAKKMGISLETFRKRMYEHNSNADWEEFADKAKKYKWVNNIVSEIRETGFVKNPDIPKKGTSPRSLMEQMDDKGQPYVKLPRLSPFDFYYIYNPDNYYR
ncbi:MAG: ATP-dependent Clp protease proteolytic subunit [Elusimicrobiota bacterium]|nr:ATP-dependent Clp protease proteolytic subunit [Elusimicrobiota bacterium]